MLISQRYRDPPPGMPLVLALFSFRYDAHLVPGLVANLTPIVHGHIAWDDRAADAAMSSEPARRNALLAEAHRQGADWLLACDPDERFEDRLAGALPDLIAEGDTILWRFACREMFSPTHWRADGVWGGKTVLRLFPAAAAPGGLNIALHGSWVADPARYRLRDSGLAYYHLRMAHPARRSLRRDLYAAADPERLYQAIGYDYLNDMRGCRLEPVAARAAFSPPFVEDGGLWAPDPGDIGPTPPDPFEARLSFAASCLAAQGGARAAFHALSDLADASPADADLAHAAGRAALRAGLPEQALSRAEALLSTAPQDLHAHLLRAEAAGRLGRAAQAQASLAVAEAGLGTSPLARALRAAALPLSTDVSGPGALWRRWTRGGGSVLDGAQVPPDAGLAAVVIGFRGQPGLAEAVRSLLDQDTAAEVLVVNSGGGDCRAALAPFLDRIRLIEVEEPHYVGAARNIGVDASRAPFVAFLAGDCQAEPGWISGRLRRHLAGASSVSTPVLPAAQCGPVGLAAHLFAYAARHPQEAPMDGSHYGRSYARWLLQACGCFPPGLRIAEDDRLHALADRLDLPTWAPEVAVRHPSPEDLAALLRDARARGARKADHAPFRSLAGSSDRDRTIGLKSRQRKDRVEAALADPGGLSGRRLAQAKAVAWLVLQADRAGLAEALDRLTLADTLWQKAEALRRDDPAAALRLAGKAVDLDGQDWRKALLLGRLRHGLGHPGAEEMAERAADLAPHRPEPALARAAWAGAAGGAGAALAVIEEALCRAPGTPALWIRAADLCRSLGLSDRERAFLRAALALAPNDDRLHERLAGAHKRAGDALGAALRGLSARRIRAWTERHRRPPAGTA